MEISEVRIKLVTNPSERLRAFCSVTLNGDFVIRDLKIIDGVNGVFVAMPSRKLADRCPRCGCKNHLRAKYCNECGNHLKENRAPKDAQGRAKLHADIAHPINAACRERVQKAVVEAYQAEIERAKSPDYKPQEFEDFEDFEGELGELEESVPQPARAAAASEPGQRSAPGDPAFGDYNSLIADLKRDAAERRQNEVDPAQQGPKTLRLPPAEGQSPVGKPAYVKKPFVNRPDSPPPAPPEPVEPTHSTSGPSQEQADSFGVGL
jgi:stage V sporulation protein G